jgi:hypothetical protein
VLTLLANQPDIRTEPHHLPQITSAGMRFTQLYYISHSQVRQHERIIPP